MYEQYRESKEHKKAQIRMEDMNN
ncbi:Protein of unknown function [Lactobacillus helveticus CIRM-BIA 951]|uniref:Uncharacterized protein n=1 Tax=Lactobacillus helveticus CIRM-BIA 951 TaxID=1226334 RepID=U6F2N3_LACHE|nr:Protein of unknown function [Lactobacillus helveticus CIRM-BIA 951]